MLPQQVTDFVIGHFCTMSLRYQTIRLVFGTLYPAYASYKAVRTKNVKEYVKWMMYWIVFALFTCAETITDVFLSWFPFYYEIKIVLVLWLLSPATKGSSILYRKFVHPMLSQREQEIDDYIAKAKEQGYHTVLNLGSKGVTYATNVIMQTAIKSAQNFVPPSQLQVQTSQSESSLSTLADRIDGINPSSSTDIKKSKSNFDLPMDSVQNLIDLNNETTEDDSDINYDEAKRLEEELKKKLLKNDKTKKGVRGRSKKGSRKIVHVDPDD